MANWEKQPAVPTTEKKRWEKILALSDNTPLWDVSTGKVYKRGMFEPVHKDGFENVVDYFKLKGSDEQVYVAFIRLYPDDRRSCSLMKQGVK